MHNAYLKIASQAVIHAQCLPEDNSAIMYSMAASHARHQTHSIDMFGSKLLCVLQMHSTSVTFIVLVSYA